MRGCIWEARTRARGSHNIADESRRPSVIIGVPVINFLASFIVHSCPGGLAAIGVLPEPPILSDALPKSWNSLKVVVSIGASMGRVIIDPLSEQPPFLFGNRHRIRATKF